KLHLAQALDDLATSLRRLGELAEAEPHAQQSEKLFLELVEADPEEIDNQMRLIQVQHNCGGLEMDLLRIAAAKAHLRRSRDGLVKLARQGKLDGRQHEKDEMLPRYQAELAACDAVAATPGDLTALKNNAPSQAARLLRIRVGVLLAEGRFAE